MLTATRSIRAGGGPGSRCAAAVRRSPSRSVTALTARSASRPLKRPSPKRKSRSSKHTGRRRRRPLQGDPPPSDRVPRYKKAKESPILKLLLSRLDELIERVSLKKSQ